MRKLNSLGFSAVLFLAACGAEVAREVPVTEDSAVSNDTFGVMLANTMRVLSKDGTVQNWTFNEDGTVTSLTDGSGTWELNGDTLCTLYGEKTTPGCWELPRGKAVGDTWDQVVAPGKSLRITIVEGR